MIRVLLADDHEIVRLGLRAILEEAQDIEVVGEVATAEAAITAAQAGGIDVSGRRCPLGQDPKWPSRARPQKRSQCENKY